MSGLRALGRVNSVGGPLGEDEFWECIAAMQRGVGRTAGPRLMVPLRTLELGRDAALAAAGVANWCWAREAELPWWRWLRRREWRAAGIRAAKDAEGFWQMFGTGDVC